MHDADLKLSPCVCNFILHTLLSEHIYRFLSESDFPI